MNGKFLTLQNINKMLIYKLNTELSALNAVESLLIQKALILIT